MEQMAQAWKISMLENAGMEGMIRSEDLGRRRKEFEKDLKNSGLGEAFAKDLRGASIGEKESKEKTNGKDGGVKRTYRKEEL